MVAMLTHPSGWSKRAKNSKEHSVFVMQIDLIKPDVPLIHRKLQANTKVNHSDAVIPH